VHATHVDHECTLPTASVDRARDFEGQRFVHYLPQAARFAAAAMVGFEASELGIAAATGGFASVRVLRVAEPVSAARGHSYLHDADLLFHFVLRGQLTLDGEHRLSAASAFVIPAGRSFAWSEASADLELLEVAVPGGAALDRVVA
jgi:hypothetical protein